MKAAAVLHFSKSSPTRPNTRTLVALASAAAFLGALFWALGPSPIRVDIATALRGTMQVTVDEEGKTRVRQVYVISAPVTGRLRRSSLDPGDGVVANETVVAVIEPTAPMFHDARTRREAETQVEAARASEALAQAEVRQAEAELGWANSELARTRTLSRSSIVSARAFERAKLDVEKQEAALSRARASLQVRSAEVATALARLIGPETIAETDGTPSKCCVEVRAPKSGKVLRELQESERVVLAGTPLFEIGDPLDIDIVVELLSTDAVRVTPGALARVDGAGLEAPVTARVRLVEPAGFTKVSALGIEEQRVRTFLDFEGASEAWSRLGHDYRVIARIVTWRDDKALHIPLSGLFRQGEHWAVYRMIDGRAHFTPIIVGHRNNDSAEVLNGLNKGDRMILHPSDKVRDGSRVADRNDRR